MGAGQVNELQDRITYMREDATRLQVAHQRVSALINRLASGEPVTGELREEAIHTRNEVDAAMHHLHQRAQSWEIAQKREERGA